MREVLNTEMKKDNFEKWQEDLKVKTYPTLSKSLKADVAIIGGGMMGVISAYLLSKAGKKVVLVEKKTLGGGATGVTTAFTTEILDTDAKDLVKMFGEEKSAFILESHQKAIDWIEHVSKDENIDSEFIRVSDYIYSATKSEAKKLEEEYDIYKSLGVKASLKKDKKLQFKNSGYIEVKDQGKFHPLKFLGALAKKAEENGALIYENTEVKKIRRTTVILKNGEKIIAKDVIVATYDPFNKPLGLYFKKAFYTSYIYEIEVPAGEFVEGIYEDMENPYHYFRVDKMKGCDRIIVGGEDHRSDIKVSHAKNFQALHEYVMTILKGVEYRIISRWYGSILEPIDGLAFIGEIGRARHIHYAFGFSGNGMTYSVIAGQMLTNKITGKDNGKLDKIYDASRIPSFKSLAIKGRDYAEELIHGAAVNSLKYRNHAKKPEYVLYRSRKMRIQMAILQAQMKENLIMKENWSVPV